MEGRWSRRIVIVVGALSGIAILLCVFTLFALRRGAVGSLTGKSKLAAVLAKIDSDYVDSVSLPEIEEKALISLVRQLDPHSEFMPAEVMEELNAPLRGDFEGVGITFNMLTDTVIVQSVIPGGPSDRAGIVAGDRVIVVDSIEIAGRQFRQDSIVRLLRGPKGTEVRVRVARGGEADLLPFTITRGKIPINSVEAAYLADSVTGVIRLSRFAMTTPMEMQEAAIRLLSRGMQRLILDLRGNSGGFMEAAHFVASLFLRRDQLIVYFEGKNRPRSELSAPEDGGLRNIPMAVLVDEFSASSSEIVAGALQDNDRAVIIGRRTFGKGLVQEQFLFPDGSGLKLTVARYFTPSGRCIQKPYTLGQVEDYAYDLEQRWLHGEFTDRDSIHQDTLQRYFTLGGRTVYGGGGIMPDVFVPLDTIDPASFLAKVNRQVLVLKFSQIYLDAHRRELQRFTDPWALREALRAEDLLAEFVAYARNQGLAPRAEELRQSGEILQTQLYAHIARGILDSEGFYPLMLEIDPPLRRAVEILRSPDPLAAVTGERPEQEKKH